MRAFVRACACVCVCVRARVRKDLAVSGDPNLTVCKTIIIYFSPQQFHNKPPRPNKTTSIYIYMGHSPKNWSKL